MNTELHLGKGGKSSDNKSFSLIGKVTKLLYKGDRLLRHYGTKVLAFLSALVPGALATFGKITQKTMAFTLAETLIVMGVIGIVSALTLPNLNSSTGDKEIVVKVKKTYQNLNDALGRAEAVYGKFPTWFLNDTTNAQVSKRAGERLTDFIKISKNCGLATGQKCFNDEVDDDNEVYKVITADGTSLGFKSSGVGSSLKVEVDINGPTKGNNIGGKDSFSFVIVSSEANEGIVPYNYYKDTFSNVVSAAYDKYRGACTTWIVKYDNADYLKFKNASGLCPNNTTVSESHPRCK